MFQLSASDINDITLRKCLAVILNDVTVPADEITKIEFLADSEAEADRAEALRLCKEIMVRLWEKGSPTDMIWLRVSAIVTPAIQAIEADGGIPDTKSVLEKVVANVPVDLHNTYLTGFFVGQLLAEAQFMWTQREAMAQAQNMLNGSGLGGVMSMLGGGLPDPAAILRRLRPPKGGEGEN